VLNNPATNLIVQVEDLIDVLVHKTIECVSHLATHSFSESRDKSEHILTI